MIRRSIQIRAIIQKSDGSASYYPIINDCITNAEYPFSCSVASVELATTSTVQREHLAPIRCDDIIRVQVSEKLTPEQDVTWFDIFEGRIMDITSNFDSMRLDCRGHEEELVYRAVTSDYSSSSNTTGTIVDALVSTYLTRITDATTSLIDASNSSTLTAYNVQQNTKYVTDAIKELEELEGYSYRFSVVPHYTSGLLDAVYASWQPLSSVATQKLKIIESTPRFVNAYFKASISSLVNDVTVYGASGTPQKVGTDTDTISQTAYNTRHHVETDTTLTTDSLCGDLASAILEKFNNPLISGQATVKLCPYVYPGDLVYCKIPSIYVNGSYIDGNYRVVRVQHNVKEDTTVLDLGEIIVSSPWQIVQGFHTKNRLIDSQFID